MSSMASESVKMSSVEVLPTPEKPLTDKKNYRAIRLPNGLRALLISDTSYPLDKLAMEEEQEEADKGKEASADEEEEEGDSEEEDEDLEEEEESEEESEEEDEDDSPMAKKKSSSSGGLKKSAAALCVGAGSFSDPILVPKFGVGNLPLLLPGCFLKVVVSFRESSSIQPAGFRGSLVWAWREAKSYGQIRGSRKEFQERS